MAKLKSAVVYNGPSRLDASVNIIGVVTGIDGASDNPKTGAMAQLWILRSDMKPTDAVKAKLDGAICGDCPYSGNGCYVAIKNAPLSVFNAFERASYHTFLPIDVNYHLRTNGVPLRLGAYGDPAALPLHVLTDLTSGIDHTGYTHAWRYIDGAYASLLMASADSVSDMVNAQALGYRTFRTRAADQALQAGEIICPASDEAGHRTTCERCTLCDGKRAYTDGRKSIAIIVHGSQSKRALTVIRSKAAYEANR